MAKPVFKPVTGKNSYCGPTALAAFTGLSTDEIARIVRLQTGKPAVKGLHRMDLMNVVRYLGGRAEIIDMGLKLRQPSGVSRRPTLKEWIAARADELKGKRLIVETPTHYVAVSGEMVLCSVQRREKRHYLSAAYANCDVVRVIELTLPDKIAPPPAARKPKDTARTARGKAKALAQKLHVDIRPTGYIRNEFELEPRVTADWRPLAEAQVEELGVDCWWGVMREWSGGVSLLDGWDEVLDALTQLKGAIDDALLKQLGA